MQIGEEIFFANLGKASAGGSVRRRCDGLQNRREFSAWVRRSETVALREAVVPVADRLHGEFPPVNSNQVRQGNRHLQGWAESLDLAIMS